MFINNFDPVAFQILSLEIRWYSLAYIFGILFGWIYCKKKLIKDPKILNLFDDLLTYIIIGIILGGRLGYVLFYNFNYFLKNFTEIFMIWNGGMSFHGGILGVIIGTAIFAKKHKINSLVFLDLISLVAPIGIFLGRIANFINSELYGHETSLPWGVKFIQVDDLYRHPTQLYEAIFEGIILFLILLFFSRKENLKMPGILSALFLIFYSIFRFIIEYFRVPDEQLGYLVLNATMGQLISLIFFSEGLFLLYKKINAQKKL